MRVLQLNVWGVRGDWERRREVLRQELARLRPDLVTLQEVIRTDAYDQAAGNSTRKPNGPVRPPRPLVPSSGCCRSIPGTR